MLSAALVEEQGTTTPSYRRLIAVSLSSRLMAMDEHYRTTCKGCVLCMPRTRYFHFAIDILASDPGRPIIIGKHKMPIFVFSDKLSHKNTKTSNFHTMPSFIYQRHVMEHGSQMRLWPSSRSSLPPLRFGFHTEASLATSLCSFVDLLVPLRLR